jgi:hypothetical protein
MSPFVRRPGLPPHTFEPDRRRRRASEGAPRDQYEALHASLLYCPQCRQATPTRERLLLVLPNGDLYEYRCAHCGTSTGSRTDQDRSEGRLILP